MKLVEATFAVGVIIDACRLIVSVLSYERHKVTTIDKSYKCGIKLVEAKFTVGLIVNICRSNYLCIKLQTI